MIRCVRSANFFIRSIDFLARAFNRSILLVQSVFGGFGIVFISRDGPWRSSI
jgi:hypothetical protein